MKKIFIGLFLLFAFCNTTYAAEFMMGADGAMFMKEGNTVISSKGIAYQMSGNTVIGSDGSVCTNNNGIVKCRNINDDNNDKYRRDDRYRRNDRYRRDYRYNDRDYYRR